MFEFLILRIAALFMLLFIAYFTVRRYSKTHTFLLFFIIYVLTTGADYYESFYDPNKYHWFIMTLVIAAIVVGATYFISKFRDFRALFIILIASNFVCIGSAAISLMMYLTHNAEISLLTGVFVHSITFMIMEKTVAPVIKDDLATVSDQKIWGPFCILPALFYVAITALCIWPQNIQEHPSSIPGVIILIALMVTNYLIIIILFKRQRSDTIRSLNIEFLGTYSDRIKAEMTQLQSSYRELEKSKLDIKLVANSIESYIKKGEYEEALAEAHTLNSREFFGTKQTMCENIALNAIILEKEIIAKENGITIDKDIKAPASLGNSEYEFATILSKFIQEAITSAVLSSNKTVRINIYTSGSYIFFEIRCGLPQEKVDPSMIEKMKLIESRNTLLANSCTVEFIKIHNGRCETRVHTHHITTELIFRIS